MSGVQVNQVFAESRAHPETRRQSVMADHVLGIDVSHHQKPIDWQRVAAVGYRYAFVRTTYGSHRKDRRFAEHWAGAEAAGLVLSAYHFMRTSDPVDRQVDLMLEVLGDRKPGMPLALDVENDPTPGDGAPMSRAAWTEWTLGCLDRLEAAGHKRPIIYTAGSFWNTNLERSERWSKHDLWVAHYTEAGQPRLPLDWSTYRFWQFTSQEMVPGIDGNADVNRFPGTEADFLAYAGGAPAPARVAPRLLVRVEAPVNVRTGPSIKHDKVAMLTDVDLGRRLPVHDVGGTDAWIRVGEDRWATCSVPSGPLCRIEVAPDGQVLGRVLAANLNVHRGPGPDFEKTGVLKRDDGVDVLEVGGSDAWVRWAPGQWTAMQVGGRRFLAVEDGARSLDIAGARSGSAMRAAERRKRPRSDDG
ncbi:hypothetical protein DCC79_00430 [bacterium]|nr:MAG: hypothetical protein DCC79_00430 [bacterium]